jgi:hypothetical protein
MRITIRHRGDFSRAKKYFSKAIDAITLDHLSRYGEEGVLALTSATPVDSGKTALSWRYEIEKNDSGYAIVFHNDNIVDGWFNVAIMLDVGHGTGSGGWVEGRNYIDPAIQPIFDKMAHDAWLEVISL